MPIVKHKGIALELGGDFYVIPPLPLGALEQLQAAGGTVQGDLSNPIWVTLMLDLIHTALRRNYPDMTRETVGDLIDLGNLGEVVEAVMDVSGVLRKQLEAAPPGEPMGQPPQN